MLSSSLCICFRNPWSNHPQRVRFGPHLLTSLCLTVDDPKGCVLSRLLCSLYTSVCIASLFMHNDRILQTTWRWALWAHLEGYKKIRSCESDSSFNMVYIFKRKSGEEADSKCVTLTETRCFSFDRWSQLWHVDKPHRQTDSIHTAFENSSAVLTLTHFTFDFSLHWGEIGGEPANSQSQKRTHHWSDVCWNLLGFCSTPCLTTGAGVVWTRLN